MTAGSPSRSPRAAAGIVILDEDVAGVRASKVFSDNEQGGYLAGRHLIDMGHRRIAFFGGPEAMRSTQARLAGVRRAIAESGGRRRSATSIAANIRPSTAAPAPNA